MLTAAAFWGLLPATAGIERCRRQLADADGNRYVEASARCALGALVAMEGRFGEAREEVARGTAIAETFGRDYLSAVYSQFAAAVEFLAGRPDAAETRPPALPRPGAPERDGRALHRAADLAHARRPGPRRRGRGLRRHQPDAGRPRGPLRLVARWRGAMARVLAGQGGGGHAALEPRRNAAQPSAAGACPCRRSRAGLPPPGRRPPGGDRAGIGNLARLAWDDPEFQGRLNETRMQFANQISGVLRRPTARRARSWSIPSWSSP